LNLLPRNRKRDEVSLLLLFFSVFSVPNGQQHLSYFVLPGPMQLLSL